MLKFRSALFPENVTPTQKQTLARAGSLLKFGSPAFPSVRRQLTPEGGRALELLGHAIEYLADEYANDLADKGPLGSADPRVAAIQILKGLNRAIYYSGTQVEPALGRMKRWLLGSRAMVR